MKKIIISLLAVSVFAPIPAVISAETDDDEARLEELTVTATRREESIMDIDQSIQSVTEFQLEMPIFKDLPDVINLVPGATAYGTKQPVKNSMQFRGSGIVQNSSGDGQSPVGYYVDDVPYVDLATPSGPPIGTFDLQRIEILRGPQGTSYGLDSTAGSLLMRTNPVDLENFGYKLKGSVSDVDGVNGNGHGVGVVVNVPVVEDVFGIRVAFQTEEDPGYGRVDTRPDITNPLESTRDTLRVKALWNVTDNFDLEATYAAWETEYGIIPGTQILDSSNGELLLSPIETGNILSLYPDGRVKNNIDVSWSTFIARADLGFATLTSSTGYVDAKTKEVNSEFIFDVGSGPLKSGVVANQPAESLTQEFRLVSNTEGPLSWLGGLFYLDAEANERTFQDIPAFFIYLAGDTPQAAEAFAVYGDVEYQINEQWSVQGGLRYHDEERSQTSQEDLGFIGVDDPFGPFSVPGAASTVTRDFDHTSYRFGVNWTPTDNGLVYLTHASTSRAPIILDDATVATLAAEGYNFGGDFDPAELINTELGAKWSFLDDSLLVEAAYVLGDWRDIPLWSEIAPGAGGMSTSIAFPGTDADVETFELSVTWDATENLSLTYATAITDTKVTSIPDPNVVTGFPPVIKVGGELYNYSPTTHNLGINYTQPIGDSGWDFVGSANYVTRDKPNGINPFAFPNAYVPARDKYENLGLSVGASKGPWELSLSVANATDDDGQYLPRTAAGGGDAQLFGLIQQPRTVALQVIYNRLP